MSELGKTARQADNQRLLMRRRLEVVAAFGAASATFLGLGFAPDEAPLEVTANPIETTNTSAETGCLIFGAQTVEATGENDTNGLGSAIVTHTEGVNWGSTCYKETVEWVVLQNQNNNFQNIPGQQLVVPETVMKVRNGQE